MSLALMSSGCITTLTKMVPCPIDEAALITCNTVKFIDEVANDSQKLKEDYINQSANYQNCITNHEALKQSLNNCNKDIKKYNNKLKEIADREGITVIVGS